MVEAREQRDLALLQQRKLQATNDFLAHLLSDAGSSGESLTLTELLDRGVSLIETQYDANAPFLASTLYDISALYSTLGETAKRRELLEFALQRAGDENDALIAEIMCARVRLNAYSDRQAAHDELKLARSLLSRLDNSANAGKVYCHRAAGLLLAAEGDRQAAITEYREALATIDRMPIQLDVARLNIMNDIAEQYFGLGQNADALKMLEQTSDLYEALGRGHMLLAIIGRLNRAAVISRMGEVASAAVEQREVLARLDRIGRPLVGARTHYAGSLVFLGEYAAAEPLIEAELAAATAADNPRWIAGARLQLATLYARQGALQHAETQLQRAAK